MSSVTAVRDRDAALVGGGVCNDTGVKPTIGDLGSGIRVQIRGNESLRKINPLLFQNWSQISHKSVVYMSAAGGCTRKSTIHGSGVHGSGLTYVGVVAITGNTGNWTA